MKLHLFIIASLLLCVGCESSPKQQTPNASKRKSTEVSKACKHQGKQGAWQLTCPADWVRAKAPHPNAEISLRHRPTGQLFMALVSTNEQPNQADALESLSKSGLTLLRRQHDSLRVIETKSSRLGDHPTRHVVANVTIEGQVYQYDLVYMIHDKWQYQWVGLSRGASAPNASFMGLLAQIELQPKTPTP